MIKSATVLHAHLGETENENDHHLSDKTVSSRVSYTQRSGKESLEICSSGCATPPGVRGHRGSKSIAQAGRGRIDMMKGALMMTRTSDKGCPTSKEGRMMKWIKRWLNKRTEKKIVRRRLKELAEKEVK
jgi:hypothetical protein